MKTKKSRSIITVADGAIIKAIDYELDKTMSNINDINTDDKARKITITLTLKPEKDKKQIELSCDVKSSLRPTKQVEVLLFNQIEFNPESKERINFLQEVADLSTAPLNLDGKVKEAPSPIMIGLASLEEE